jgi:hypothetical protein
LEKFKENSDTTGMVVFHITLYPALKYSEKFVGKLVHFSLKPLTNLKYIDKIREICLIFNILTLTNCLQKYLNRKTLSTTVIVCL